MEQKQIASVLLSDLLPSELPNGLGLRFLRLCGEAFFFMAFALLFPFVLGLMQGAMIALFLVSSSLMGRLRQLMDENRFNIWVLRQNSWKANQLSAVSILGIFFGLFLANILFSLILANIGAGKGLEHFFDFILKTVNLHPDQPLAHRFTSFWGILFNNYVVLITTIILTAVYRAYGLILVLSWNACIWAVLLFYMFRHAWITSKISTIEFLARSLGAMLPHLMLEATAYILAALGALFWSRSSVLYKSDDPRYKSVLKASGTLLVLACIIVLLAGICETTLPPALLSF